MGANDLNTFGIKSSKRFSLKNLCLMTEREREREKRLHQFLPLAVKTVFLAAAELSAEDVLVIVGDLNETVPAPLDVVSGPGVVADGMMI